ncbi:DUF2938 domain-containing protein [Pseudophaeobacter arcticus]|uniref:DUF2938 domain-containing protein n=1 Tax=Pseudophaeobacter arcticus TaxID=385492 RepID=UPI0024922B78|nr:DUF2938 domain-containing protein [Pseudophaeobacter arcticus]
MTLTSSWLEVVCCIPRTKHQQKLRPLTMVTQIFMNAALIGVGATAFMDLIALAQKHVLSQQPLNYAMVGRWFGHMIRGKFVHRPISASRPIPFERVTGWSSHYLIGVLFALAFLALVGDGWLKAPSLLPALAFGALTVLAPFLVVQPGMGAGLFARNLPNPNVARLKSAFAHLSFGIGLWAAACCASAFS